MAGKLYYSMGEVTEMFAVEPSLIRYWCSQFSCLRPKRNAKGNRMFSPQDIERLKRIHHLLKEKKMTIEGAQKAMRKSAIEAEKNDSDMALLEQLQRLRSMLVDMRQTIGDDTPLEDIEVEIQPSIVDVVDEPVAEVVDEPIEAPIEELVTEEVVAEEPVIEQIVEVEAVAESVVELVNDQIEEPEKGTVEEMAETPDVEEAVAEVQVEQTIGLFADVPAEKPSAEEQTEEPQAEPTQKKKRAPRRKLKGEEGVVERPLFPFYEQTLF